MGFTVKIQYSRESSSLDPKEKQLVIAGQPSFLKLLRFDEVSKKFGGRISEEVKVSLTLYTEIVIYIYESC